MDNNSRQRATAEPVREPTTREASAGSSREAPAKNRSSIDPEEFQRFLGYATQLGDGKPQSLRSWLDLAEAWQITRALRLCRGNRSAAARALGIGRRTLYAKMEKLSITASWGV